jgi:hypothetical protein
MVVGNRELSMINRVVVGVVLFAGLVVAAAAVQARTCTTSCYYNTCTTTCY